MSDKQYPIGGYAPGFYTCTCCICKNEFQGDKRAFQCEPCATKALHPSESAGVLPADNEVSKWFEENIDKGCSASSAIYKFRLWLKELNVGAGVKGAVWVKASERLPKVYGKITWRWLDEEAAYIGYVENRGFIYDTGGASVAVDPLYYNEIEWLDESPSLAPDQAGKEDAVALLNWMTENGIVINRDGEIWQKPNNKLFTPDQLFDLYQQSKNK